MRHLIYIKTLLVFYLSLIVHADDWPQYLGPSRDTVWNENGVKLNFDETPPSCSGPSQ